MVVFIEEIIRESLVRIRKPATCFILCCIINKNYICSQETSLKCTATRYCE